MTHVKPVRFGKYLLLDPIAVGGMAELFRARMEGDEGFQKVIAVKKILPKLVGEKRLVEAFIREARLAANLQHDNIVRTLDFGKMGDDYFIAMEYLFGKNLRLIADRAEEVRLPMSMVNVIHVVSQLLIGLEYAHDLADFSGTPLQIIHRDISPPNIFVTYNGQVKIVDFGVAKATSQASHTQAGTIKGKIAYMSPEQADGQPVDQRTDLFAAGAILYELVTAKRLYTGETMEVLAKARQARFTPPENVVPGLHARLSAIITKSLARDPDDRYATAGEMLADLEDFSWEMNFRPSARGLARYMGELFKDTIREEEEAMRQVLGLAEEIPGEEPPPEEAEKTVFMGAAQNELTFVEPEDSHHYISCPSCLKPVEDSNVFCPWCGIQISEAGRRQAREKAARSPAQTRKLCLLGAAGVGKTSLMRRFADNAFSPEPLPAMGVTVMKKPVNFEGRKLVLNLWSIPGDDRYLDLRLEDLSGMDGYLLAVDCTRSATLETAVALKQKLEKHAGRVPFVLVITKTDRNLDWDIPRARLNELSAKGWIVIRTSAKTGVGVNKAFMTLAEEILHPEADKGKAQGEKK